MGPAPAIGIDLGTTFCSAAVYRNEKTEVIPNKEGQRLTPSFIFYHPDSLNVSVGTTADDMGPQKINNFLFDVKRLIGRKYDDVYVQELQKSEEYRFKIVKGDDEKAEIELTYDGEKVSKTPEQASSEILRYLRESASEYLGGEVTEAVISVPAHFSNAQRKATLAAAELAGLKVLKLITEPVAAAIHYAEDRLDTNATLLVFDFGGGTLDVSIIEVDEKTFQVKSVEGDTYLGGRDFDQILLQYFKAAMTRTFGNTIFNDRLLRRVKDCCIRLKVKLSTEQKYSLPMYCIGGNEDRNFTFSLSRDEFESLSKTLFERALHLLETCIKEAGLSKNKIDEVVLVGGSTRIPKVRKMLSYFFGNKELRTDLNPDEAVALGAAIQAALIKEKFRELEKYKITEITPLSLGIGVYGGLMEVIVKKNTPLPFRSSPVTCVTLDNNQKSIIFEIYEGERKNCKFNNFLGSFIIDNLLPGRAGDVKFRVVFSLNEDGILEVNATEISTGQNNNLVVTIGEYRLCEYKIRRTIENAEKNRQEDKIFKKFIQYMCNVRRICNHIIYDLNKITSDVDRSFVETRCVQLKHIIKELNYTEINKMKQEYKAFHQSIKGIIHNKINVDFTENDEFSSLNLNTWLVAMGSNLNLCESNNPNASLATFTKKRKNNLTPKLKSIF